jgi:spore coat polysaccharide biosynthesis predicted glycosyltransferase SpsG
VVIDWTIGAEQKPPSTTPAEVSFLLGSRYCALRPEFQSFESRAFPASPRSILVTFGGSDIRSLTAPVLAMLEAEFPDLEKFVVLGPGSQMKSAAAFGNSKTSFHVGADAACMQSLMARADLAVSGGGQTLYELASQGLPPVVVPLAADQADDVRGFTQAGFSIDAGPWQMPGLLDRIAIGLRDLWPAALRERHSAAGRKSVDGQGAERLVAAVLNAWS